MIETLARGTAAAVAAAVFVCPARAQTLAERVAELHDGVVHMRFAAREGVCRWGERTRGISRNTSALRHPACGRELVYVSLQVSGGAVVDLDMGVGDRRGFPWDGTDLGRVAAAAAADYLVGVAAAADSDPGKEAIVAAALADSATVWPGLARLARDASRPEALRAHAIFWMGQVPGSTPGLIQLYDDLESTELRERVIFTYAQKDGDDDALEALMAIARSERDRTLRGRAIFWLGHVRDPRAVQLLAELIMR